MKRLLIGALTVLGACKGSDFAIAVGLDDAEAADIVAKCDLAIEDYRLISGKLVISREVPFEKAQCALKMVQALGKYSGPEVGNEKYVTPKEGQ